MNAGVVEQLTLQSGPAAMYLLCRNRAGIPVECPSPVLIVLRIGAASNTKAQQGKQKCSALTAGPARVGPVPPCTEFPFHVSLKSERKEPAHTAPRLVELPQTRGEVCCW